MSEPTNSPVLLSQGNVHQKFKVRPQKAKRKGSFVSGGLRKPQPKHLLTEYALNSTIHGVKYLGAPDRPWPERLWWIIMFVISITVCTALITNTYNKWTSDPVIVTFSQMATPVWHIPFPAVSVVWSYMRVIIAIHSSVNKR